MNKLKLMTILGTRPEIIRLSEIIKKCDLYFDHTLVHTGQNYDYTLNGIFFPDLGLRVPDHTLDVAGANLGETLGRIIARSYTLLRNAKPDALLILGDTNSSLASISAKRLHIPVFHMEAGNRCFDECLPEETNRRMVDHIADVNLCYSEQARRHLNREGVAPDRTFVVGSPMAEVLSAHQDRIFSSTALQALGLEVGKYILLSAHREENIDNEAVLRELVGAVNGLADRYALPIVYSAHPRSAERIRAGGFQFNERVRILRPFSFTEYNQLQINAFCVVSDSGTLPEEASCFSEMGRSFPAVSLRVSTERPEALEKGRFILAGTIGTIPILQAVEMATAPQKNRNYGTEVPDYRDKNVSDKVVRIVQGYTPIVNRVVWRKSGD